MIPGFPCFSLGLTPLLIQSHYAMCTEESHYGIV